MAEPRDSEPGSDPGRDPTSGQGAVTVSAWPDVVDDADSGARTAIAALTVTAGFSAYTSDPRPGAELVDVVVTGMLVAGFTLVTDYRHSDLAALPRLPGWRAHGTAGHFEVLDPDGTRLYAGSLGVAALPDWSAALTRRGVLAVLVGSGLDLAPPAMARLDRRALIVAAAQRGHLTAAAVGYRDHPDASTGNSSP